MTVENIERVYLSPKTELEAINVLRSNTQFTLVSESSSCFVFVRTSMNHFKLGDENKIENLVKQSA